MLQINGNTSWIPDRVGNDRIYHRSKGLFLPIILVAVTLFLAYASLLVSLAFSNIKMAELENKKITSMSIAEAGLNYYLWHLSHDNLDYCDGVMKDEDAGNDSLCPSPLGPDENGPFLHDYKDQAGRSQGSFELYVTPPGTSGSVVKVRSVGRVSGVSPKRTIEAQLGIPSFTKYTLLVNNPGLDKNGRDIGQLWLGSGEKVTGSIFVNKSGVRNDGEITGDTYSTVTTYPSWWGTRECIWGNGIFGGSKQCQSPEIDFNQLSADMADMEVESKVVGNTFYDTTTSNGKGYHIILKNNSYDLYKVTSFSNTDLNINSGGEELIGQDYSYPAKGLIFFKDDVWVEGTISNQKVTIVAADPAAAVNKMKRIIIPNSIKYSHYDGKDKIGLITQTNILVTRGAPTELEIEAAMIAQSGEIKINSYCNPVSTCLNDHKSSIKVYGSMAHNGGLLWTYELGGGRWSGYLNTETIIDNNNVLNPPPYFPTTGVFSILSWREE